MFNKKMRRTRSVLFLMAVLGLLLLSCETKGADLSDTSWVVRVGKPGLTHGSGFWFRYKTHWVIITCAHVVEKQNRVLVTDSKGKTDNAQVVAWFGDTDLAVLVSSKLAPPSSTRPYRLKNHLKVSETVYTIGYPLDLGVTVTRGILSGKNETFVSESQYFDGFLQTDAPVNPGDSGGPLLDRAGQLIGVVSARAENAEGIAFAVPMDEVLNALKKTNFKAPE